MAVRPIVLYPDPILRARAHDANVFQPDTARVLADLWDTLDSHTGVGIAAPQIGEPLRIIVVDATRARRPVPNHGRMALINPEVVLSEGEIAFREGCMSIPDFVAHVTRARTVVISAVLPTGEPTTFVAEGFEAVILQHEIDHLDGVLFIDRVRSARDLKPRGR